MERLPGTPYLAGEVMGRGPHGAVFVARDAAERRLAVKVLTPELSGGDLSAREFAGQRDTLTSLRHPHLMPVYDIVQTDTGLLAIVTERAEGGNLRQALEVVRTFPPSEACRLGAQIARALASLHATGLVHADLTATNILFNDSGSRPAVRVSDAGLTRWLAGLGRGWIPAAAAAYAAPEVAAGAVPGPPADLYSLGVLLHEMCVGVPPFVGDPADVTRRHVEEVPVRPAGIPDQLWVLVAALLAKDGAARVGPAAAVAGYLDAIATDVDRVPPAAPIGPVAALIVPAPLPDISAPEPGLAPDGVDVPGGVPGGDAPVVSPTAETDILPVAEPPAWTPPPADPAPWERPPADPAAYDPYRPAPDAGTYDAGTYDAGTYDAGTYDAAAGYGAGGYGGAGYGPVGSDPVEVAAAADPEEERARNAAYLAMYERDRRRRIAIIAGVVLLSVIGVGVAIGAVIGGGGGDDDPGVDDPGFVLPTPALPGDLASPTPTPTPEPTPTPTPTSLVPGPTPQPTPEPTPTPTPEPTPTPTIPVVTVTPPDPTPSVDPEPTPSVDPDPSPSVDPDPSPSADPEPTE